MVLTDYLLVLYLNISSATKKYFETSDTFSKVNYLVISLSKKIIVSFGNFNIFHWLILFALIWTIFNAIYLKFMKFLFQKIGVSRQDRNHLMESIWNLCFTAVSIPMLTCVGGSAFEVFSLSGNWANRLDYQLEKCKVHENITISSVKTLFVLFSSFLIHDLVKTYSSYGFKNLEFLAKQIFLAIFILTYYSKCPMLGLSMLFLLNCAALVDDLSKLCCLYAHFTGSTVLTYLSKALCGYYFLMWSVTYLYNLPVFLLKSKTIDSGMMNAEIKMLIVMDIMIWLYVITMLFTSMFSRAVLCFVLSGEERPRTLEYILFGCDPLVLKLTGQDLKRISLNYENSDVEMDRIRRNQALLQTIHCYIILKRKLRRLREKKERNAKEKEIEEIKRGEQKISAQEEKMS